jgi:polyisoprenyl-phosphate glycosyltransferase
MPPGTTRLRISEEWQSRAVVGSQLSPLDRPSSPAPINRPAEQRRPALSIVVPCYNEEDNIAPLHRRVSDVSAAVVATDYELVLINDGSTDATWERIARICDADPHVVGVNLSRNHGHQLALSAGLSVCRGRRILILDGDLQDPPELLPEMYRLMDEGADVVFGLRTERRGETWFKRVTAKLFYRVLGHLVDVPIPHDTGDFRLMSRRALDVLNSMPEQHRFVRGMVSWIGFSQRGIAYTREPRHAGATKYPLTKMVRFAVDAITGFSVKPLRLSSYIGGVFALMGLALFLRTLYVWSIGGAIVGWTSLMSVVIILGSVQLFVLGIIGEYLGRLFIEAKGRPLFVIKELRGGVQAQSGYVSAASLQAE